MYFANFHLKLISKLNFISENFILQIIDSNLNFIIDEDSPLILLINKSIKNDINMRVFESTASESLLFTDKIINKYGSIVEN